MLFMLEDLSPSLNIDLKKEKSRIESSNFLSLSYSKDTSRFSLPSPSPFKDSRRLIDGLLSF